MKFDLMLLVLLMMRVTRLKTRPWVVGVIIRGRRQGEARCDLLSRLNLML